MTVLRTKLVLRRCCVDGRHFTLLQECNNVISGWSVDGGGGGVSRMVNCRKRVVSIRN